MHEQGLGCGSHRGWKRRPLKRGQGKKGQNGCWEDIKTTFENVAILQERTRLRLEADTEDHRQARLDLQLAKVRISAELLTS